MIDARRWDRPAAIAFAAASVLLLALWPAWRLTDAPLPGRSAVNPDDFVAQAEAFAAAHAVGERDGMPLLRPKPGEVVPVVVRRFQFWPALELTAGQRVHLRLAAVDGVHSAAIAGQEVLLVPGEAQVMVLTPTQPGLLPLQCNEYCGLGHNRMRADLMVVTGR